MNSAFPSSGDVPVPSNGPTTPDSAHSPQSNVPRFDAKTSFKGADTMERMKKYLHDIPVLHARLLSLIGRLETEAKELERLRGDIEQTLQAVESKGEGDADG